jgi:ABC-type sugar transport system ATPase subunit
MSFLKISDLYKSYGNVSVLKDINIESDEAVFSFSLARLAVVSRRF